jgi:hypothetical protein
MDGKGSFYAYAIGYFPDGKTGTAIAPPFADHDAFISLDPLLLSFDNPYIYLYGITGLKIRYIPSHLFLFEHFNNVHLKLPFPTYFPGTNGPYPLGRHPSVHLIIITIPAPQPVQSDRHGGTDGKMIIIACSFDGFQEKIRFPQRFFRNPPSGSKN